MAELVLEGVSRRFGETLAVDDVTLAVDDGAFVVLLGPTGAGKTTTLRLAAGLERPDTGRVLIAGADVTLVPPAGRDVTFVFQQYSLYPHLTVFENLAFPLRSPLRRLSEAEIARAVREVAAMLRIEGKLANRATRLSGGEMQRVAIGRSLVRRPQVYLMDEPLSSLDAKLREDLRIELKRIQSDLGATVLYVTHDQIEAMTLADKVGVLAEGRLVQFASPREVYERPASVHVACRLGSPPINVLPAGALGIADGPAGAARIGVRPEDVVAGGGGVPAEVLAVEHLGAETVLLLSAGGQEVHALAEPGSTLRTGDATTAGARPGAVLFFDGAGALIQAPRPAPRRAETPQLAAC